jgi:hypothetical protein
MNPVALCSTLAIVIGLAAALPQLIAMTRARSAAGQSALGWSLGAFVNVLMGYVNAAGYHASLLALGNGTSLLICIAALLLVLRLGAGPKPTLADLPTSEFDVLRDSVHHEAERRREPAFAQHEAERRHEPAFAQHEAERRHEPAFA